jgi:serine incorporator 1/3
LVLQLVLLINFIYEINEWVTSFENCMSWTALVAGSLLSFGAGFTAIAYSYHLYAKQ